MRVVLTTKACLVNALSLLGILAGIAEAQIADFSGRPVVELIEALREQGRRVAYSRDLLPNRLRVTLTPTSTEPLAALREILAPHGLDVEIGPRDTWLIVRSESPVAVQSARDLASTAGLTPPRLETIIVTASRYPIQRRTPAATSTFGRNTLETTPALGQDPLRVTHRLPGVSSDQLTSEAHIRGGALDEVLLRLDGIRLYSPYHLKDFQNVFSSINARVIDSMDVRTGGFEARFGDRMSGVIDLKTIEPEEFRHHEVAVSFLDASVLSSGLFAGGRGAWVTSARRGNLDVLAEASDSDLGTPQYVDFFNKVGFDFSPGLRMEAGLLTLDDKISLHDGQEVSAAADYDDTYYWLTLTRSSPSGLESSYRIYSVALKRMRTGTIDDADRLTGSLDEESEFGRTGIAADWSYLLLDSVLVSFGAEFAAMDDRHQFESSRAALLPMTAPQLDGASAPPDLALIDLTQSKRSVHASFRHQLMPRLITELGLRWDAQSLTGDEQLSPRLNVRFDLTERTRLRAAWGEFAQSDSLSEIAVADGVVSPRPAAESRQKILGIEHGFGASGLFRAEIYRKDVRRVLPRYENAFERVSLLPELLPDRFAVEPLGAVTRGVEVSIAGNAGGFGWWANVASARTSEDLAGGRFPRSWDERRSLKAGGEWAGQRWTVTTTLGYRSGWPISSLAVTADELVADAFNGTGLPDFSSVDVRAGRSVELPNGEFEWFIEVSNLLDHPNYCCLDYSIAAGNGTTGDRLATEYNGLLGVVPNIGLRWQF